MSNPANSTPSPLSSIVPAEHETPLFRIGDRVRVLGRRPLGHYRVPLYLRGKTGTVAAVIEPRGLNNEEEAFGHNAGSLRHYYRIAASMVELWPEYEGSAHDRLFIEVFETWLERA